MRIKKPRECEAVLYLVGDNHYQAHQQVSFVMANNHHLDESRLDKRPCMLVSYRIQPVESSLELPSYQVENRPVALEAI